MVPPYADNLMVDFCRLDGGCRYGCGSYGSQEQTILTIIRIVY